MKPALQKKGLRHISSENCSIGNNSSIDETCPTEKGIATRLELSLPTIPSHIYDETCPTEKGIATLLYLLLAPIL